MSVFKYHHLKKYRDDCGKLRVYFRKRGQRDIPLPGEMGTLEFHEAWLAALAGKSPTRTNGASRTVGGSIDDLVSRYYSESDAFQKLAPVSKATYRRVLEKLRIEHGHRMVADLKQEHVEALVKKSGSPGAANKLLRVLKILMGYGVKCRMIDANPAQGMKKMKAVSQDGYHSWTEPEIAAYEARHPVGTMARLAFDLLLYTGQRRADVLRMGPADIRDGFIYVRQQKTGTDLVLPVLEPLARSLAAFPTTAGTFLHTPSGKPYSGNGFANWFRLRCAEAGLKGCPVHGLRKAATNRLADAGATDHEMMAWGGWKTRALVSLYTAKAEQKRGAMAAARKLQSR